MKPTIAYLEQNFPGLTTTFIYREVIALKRLGFNVVTLSVNAVQPENLSAEARPLVADTYAIRNASFWKISWSHLHFLFTKPNAYLAVLFLLTAKVKGSRQERRRTFLHFLGGVYLAVICKREKVQHIHAHFANLNATMAMIVAKLLGISYSFTAHNTCFWEQILLPEKIRGSAFVVAISNYTRNFLLAQLPATQTVQDKIHIVHCGVPVKSFFPRSYERPCGIPQILSVAQLAEHKGMADLIMACQFLKERQITFNLKIAGTGPQHKELVQLIKELHLQSQVEMLGQIFQEDLSALLQQTDIFALACKHGSNGKVDGVPVVLMEAMASGIPCVSTTVSGIPDLIDNGINGLLTEEGDIEALASALQSLLEGEKKRIALGNKAREKVVAEFDIAKTSAQIAVLLQKNIGHD